MTDQMNNDEIDLLELIEILWNGKWIIAALSGLVSIISLIGLMMLPTSFDVEMAIRPLSPQQISAYAPLNNVPGISSPVYAGENLIGYEGVVTSENLANAIMSDIASGESLRAAIKQLDPDFQNFEGSPQEEAEALIQAAVAYRAEKLLDSDNTIVGLTLTNSTRDRALTRAIIARFVEINRSKIRKDNLIAISNLKKSIEAATKYKVENLKQEMANDRQLYLDNRARAIANLTEQAQIARKLDLEAPITTTKINTSVSMAENSIGDVNTNTELFLRGYKALEEEVRLLKARDKNSWRLYTPGYAEKANELRTLQSDQRLARIETGLALSPISDAENFTPANFDMDNIIFTPSTSKLLILILVSLMAGIFSSIFVLLRHYFAERNTAG